MICGLADDHDSSAPKRHGGLERQRPTDETGPSTTAIAETRLRHSCPSQWWSAAWCLSTSTHSEKSTSSVPRARESPHCVLASAATIERLLNGAGREVTRLGIRVAARGMRGRRGCRWLCRVERKSGAAGTAAAVGLGAGSSRECCVRAPRLTDPWRARAVRAREMGVPSRLRGELWCD